jgi:hypothetical protein
MFPNVPERLAEAVRTQIPADFDDHTRDALAAGLVVVEYLRQMPLGPEADPFFDAQLNPAGGVGYEFSVRVQMIGETLFLLRNCTGFSEFCRRFRNRDFRSTYFELCAARMMHHESFDLLARPEIGIKGEDFDFRAVRASEQVNVEVTALTAPEFAARTVANALETKRKQLPTDAPSVIFCVYPERWNAVSDLEPQLSQIADDLFGRSKRINIVVFMTEFHFTEDGSTAGTMFTTFRVERHAAPRFEIQSPMLFTTKPRFLDIVSEAGLRTDAPPFRDSEFYRWLDSL